MREHAGGDLDGDERDDQRERDGELAAVGVAAHAVGVSCVIVGHRLTIRTIAARALNRL